MSIPEAAELVIQAGAMGKGGDVFVLDMGEPVKIYELAKRLINLSGMEVMDNDNPEGDIEIIFTGLKPGEKLYEELLIGDNVSITEHKQILRAEEDFLSLGELETNLTALSEAEQKGDVQSLREILKKVVSGFTPEEKIVDLVSINKTK
jgi:FlaA1/EpsC-like NDP-sugar epimerase